MARFEKKIWKESEFSLRRIFYWINDRCNNKSSRGYKNWWWRWIQNKWKNFEDFYNDMLPWYFPWLSIDRIDNDWNYCKYNCQWITRSENSRKWNKNYIPDSNSYPVKERPFNHLDVLFDDCWLNIKWYCWDSKVFSDDIEYIWWVEVHTYYQSWIKITIEESKRQRRSLKLKSSFTQ